jgi:hypothetical protein
LERHEFLGEGVELGDGQAGHGLEDGRMLIEPVGTEDHGRFPIHRQHPAG